MKSTTTSAILALPASAVTFPTLTLWCHAKRQTLVNFNDLDLLNYALTLEHLEDTFYRQGLANFTQAGFAASGFDKKFYENLSSSHTTRIRRHIFKGIGVSAYLGAARQIANKEYLTAAGSILSVESRHSSYLRASLSQLPFAQTQETPLTPDGVYTMANNFIASCPADNPTLPIKAFPDITVTPTGSAIAAGATVFIKTTDSVLKAGGPDAKLYAAFVGPNDPVWAALTSANDGMNFLVTIPTGVNGQSCLVLHKCNDTLTGDTVVAGPTFIELTSPPTQA